MSNAGYRVTAGDVYTLAYSAGGVQVTYPIAVDTSYRIRVSNLGVINAAGKTFLQLKTEAEAIVSNNYPLSGVQLVLTRPALFTVHLKGEVLSAAEYPAWALSRLSSFLTEERLTPYASLRDVTVTSTGGQSRSYDIFKARRDGDLSQDPYVRPGDTVTVKRLERQVEITGEVERPGRYQLLPGENLRELIEVYGSGFTPLADPTRLEITRYVNSVSVSGDKIQPGENVFESIFHLEHYDRVMVPVKTQLQPVLFVEGAVAVITEDDVTSLASPTVSNRLVIPFNRGEYYGTLIRRNREWFSAVSDTRSAYIIRGDRHIAINLNPMLYDEGYRGEVVIEENDTLIIPFRQYFVTVAGAVARPGRYPYIPDRDWEYYIALAGGFIPERNRRERITIVDITGKRMGKGDNITPETVITASTNHPVYYFNQYAPVITTVLSIATTTISILALINR
jgi:protein involved in polysaccharide export with SLBB domain